MRRFAASGPTAGQGRVPGADLAHLGKLRRCAPYATNQGNTHIYIEAHSARGHHGLGIAHVEGRHVAYRKPAEPQLTVVFFATLRSLLGPEWSKKQLGRGLQQALPRSRIAPVAAVHVWKSNGFLRGGAGQNVLGMLSE